MVSARTLLSNLYWKLPFTVHTDASDKRVGAVIIQNKKPIDFFSKILSKPQHEYTMTKRELLVIAKLPKQFQGILFGYEINVFSHHKNLVYAATLSEHQRVMRWRLIIKEFGINIKHIAGVDNILYYTLSILPYTNRDKHKPCTRRSQCCANELLTLGRVENKKNPPPLNLLIVRIEQQK